MIPFIYPIFLMNRLNLDMIGNFAYCDGRKRKMICLHKQ